MAADSPLFGPWPRPSMSWQSSPLLPYSSLPMSERRAKVICEASATSTASVSRPARIPPLMTPHRSWHASLRSTVPGTATSSRRRLAAAALRLTLQAPEAIPGARRLIPSSPPPSPWKRCSASRFPLIPAPRSMLEPSRVAPPSTPFPSAPLSRSISAPPIPNVWTISSSGFAA